MYPPMLLDQARGEKREAIGESAEHAWLCTSTFRLCPFALFLRKGRWERLALGIWMIILLVICVRVSLRPALNSVYPIFAHAARGWLAGVDLYRAPGDPYRYSPLITLLLVPFSVLPDQLGGVFWRLLNGSVYLGALAWWGRVALPRQLTTTQLAILFLLVIPLSVGSLNNGQSNALVLGLLLATMAAAASDRWNLASGCLALACLFKVYPLAVGLLLAVVFPQRFAGRLALALAAGLVMPFFFQEPHYLLTQYADWLQLLCTDDRQSMPVKLWYRDLRLLCHTCHLELGPTTYLAIQLLAAAAIAGICIARRRARQSRNEQLTSLLGLGCCWMTLFGSATESCTYILVAPSLAWALMDSWLYGRPFWIRSGLLASYGLFMAAEFAVWIPGAARPFHSLGIHPLAALILLICLLFTSLLPTLQFANAEMARNEHRGMARASA